MKAQPSLRQGNMDSFPKEAAAAALGFHSAGRVGRCQAKERRKKHIRRGRKGIYLKSQKGGANLRQNETGEGQGEGWQGWRDIQESDRKGSWVFVSGSQQTIKSTE